MRQRLKGASVASYYPPRIGTIAQLRSLYPENELLDEEEEDWLEHLNVARSRGKSVPKKKRTAAGMFVEKHRTFVSGADMLQNRRSSTRGSRRRTPRDIPYRRYCIPTVQESIGRRFIWMANAGSVQQSTTQNHHHHHLRILSIIALLITCSSPLFHSCLSQSPILSQIRRPRVSWRSDVQAVQGH